MTLMNQNLPVGLWLDKLTNMRAYQKGTDKTASWGLDQELPLESHSIARFI